MRVAVISLKRTPERWFTFLERNQLSLSNNELLRIDGIDGREILNSNIHTNMVTTSARQKWSAGAIGIGLSHMLCWRMCFNIKTPLLVLEDDVVLAENWKRQLKTLLHPSAGMILLGWNLDSVLRAELSNQQEMISLFEPAYPSEKALHAIVNSDEGRKSRRLIHSFGLPGYWLHPNTAKRLLNIVKPLETLPLKLGRGLPNISTYGIDGLLNIYYEQIKAEVVIPPLALALNDPLNSLTRHRPNGFGEANI